MSDTSKTAKIIKRLYFLPSHHLIVNVQPAYSLFFATIYLVISPPGNDGFQKDLSFAADVFYLLFFSAPSFQCIGQSVQVAQKSAAYTLLCLPARISTCVKRVRPFKTLANIDAPLNIT